jgi:signal peptidase I
MDQSPPSNPELSTLQKFLYGTGCFYELTKWIIIVLTVGILVHFFVGTIFIVDGQSMEPNLHSDEYIIVNRWQYNFGKPLRGDAVVLRFPGDPENKKYIKRIIGLPGETVTIASGKVYINGVELKESYIPDYITTEPNLVRQLTGDDYFLLGDNRPNSSDSRIWGICPKRDLIGKAWLIFYPLSDKGLVPKVQY